MSSFLPKAPAEIAQAPATAVYGKLPMHFEPNAGQTDRRVKFLSLGAGYTLFPTSEDAELALPKSAVLRMKYGERIPGPKSTGLEELRRAVGVESAVSRQSAATRE